MKNFLKIANSPLELTHPCLYYVLKKFVSENDLLLKIEGLNPAGSIKIKPAIQMLESLEAQGLIDPTKNRIIESSSGNLGIALSLACQVKGYKFICVTDPNINEISKKYIRLYGGELIVVNNRDENGGFLNTRIRLIREKIKNDPSLIWLNQYASLENIRSHALHTAAEIFETIGPVDILFVGAGTTGTLMGCAQYIQKNNLPTRLIAVDAAGSVTFGFPPSKRLIPGLGTSRKPEIINPRAVNDVIVVSEADTILMCRHILKQEGLFVGGSTGTVLAGIKKYSHKISSSLKLAAISPDLGDRYMNTIYDDEWVNRHFPGLLGEQIEERGVRCENF